MVDNFTLLLSFLLNDFLVLQMEQNVEFIQKKRDEVAFSPKDHQSVESFLQVCTIIFTANEFFFGLIFYIYIFNRLLWIDECSFI